MITRTTFKLIRLALIVATLLLAIEPGFAQMKPAPGGLNSAPLGQQMTITDAAGRTHVRATRITYAQRKAAAQARVKALRAAALKKAQSGVKK